MGSQQSATNEQDEGDKTIAILRQNINKLKELKKTYKNESVVEPFDKYTG